MSGEGFEILRGKVRWTLGESRRGPLVLIQSAHGFHTDIRKTRPCNAKPGEGYVLGAQNPEETHCPPHLVLIGVGGAVARGSSSCDGKDG